jgi:hypothetical protein
MEWSIQIIGYISENLVQNNYHIKVNFKYSWIKGYLTWPHMGFVGCSCYTRKKNGSNKWLVIRLLSLSDEKKQL